MTPPADESGLPLSVETPFRWRARDLLFVLAATLVSHLYNGLEYGLDAHSTQLVLVQHLDDPSLFPGDLFVDSLGQYCSWFWVGVAWLARLIDVRWVLVGSHLLSRFLLLAAIYNLTARMFPAPAVRFVALALSALRLRAILAGEVLISPLPTHTTFAFPLLVWGMIFAWRAKPVRAAVALGVACNLNVMTGLPATFVAGAGFLFAGRRTLRGRAAAAALIWFVIALPVLGWASRSPPPDVDPEAYYRTIRDVFWYHFDPLRWGGAEYVRLVGLLVLLAIGLGRAGRHAFHRPLVASLAAIGVTWIGALVASRASTLEPLMRLQLARTATLAVVVSIPLAAAAFRRCSSDRRPVDWVVMLALAMAWGAAHGRTAAIILGALGIWHLSRSSAARSAGPARRRATLVSGLAVGCAAVLFAAGVYRACLGGDRTGVILRSPDAPWLAVQRWARDHTPRDAVFVAPLHEVGFRVFSRRSLWFGFDHDAMLWRPDLTSEIQRRHRLLAETGLADKPLAGVDWNALFRLARIERIDYAVVPSGLVASWPTVYRNVVWAVVPLNSESDSGSADPPN